MILHWPFRISRHKNFAQILNEKLSFKWYAEKFNTNETFAYDVLYNFNSDSNQSYGNLKIYFKENEFITSKRSELYGRTEFLAACGGILGLFIGVTALSFVEIFYYFTLRLAWTLQMYRYKKSDKSTPSTMNKFWENAETNEMFLFDQTKFD